MSFSRNSSRRTPASNPFATMSMRRFSTWTSSEIFGWRAANRGRTGVMTKGTAISGTLRRTLPVTSPGRADAAFSASTAWLTAGPRRSSNPPPASVSAALRVVRKRRTVPSRASSWRTDWLRAEGEIPNSAAAAAKLRRRATARKAFRAFSEVTAILKIYYGAHPVYFCFATRAACAVSPATELNFTPGDRRQENAMRTTPAFAAVSAKAPLAPFSIERREPGPRDVLLEILFCGVCHSDIHQARDEWGGSRFPMVPGHEIVGRVRQVGREVTRFKSRDLAGVGCMVDSCRSCAPCRRGLQQFCEKGAAFTYNGTEMDRTTPTFGGYSTEIVVADQFVLQIPAGLDPAGAAPLLCAGITTYSPLRQWNCKKGDRVGVVGLGGLGHMAVQLAASLGAEVTMLSTSKAKEADARRLGASGFEITKDPKTFEKLAGRFDLIIDTISAPHDCDT